MSTVARRRLAGVGGAFLVLALLAAAPASGQESDRDLPPAPVLHLTETPGGPATERIVIELLPSEGAATRKLFVTQRGSAPIELRFGVSLPRATANLSADTGEGGVLELRAAPAVAPLTLSISNVPGDLAASTTLEGVLYALTADDRVLPLAAVEVVRPPIPSVAIADAGDSGVLSQRAPSSAWRETLTLVAKSAPPITGITIEQTALNNENGSSARVGVQVNGRPNFGEPFDIAAGANSATITLSADLIDTGVYRGSITVRQGQRAQVVRLEIDRTRVAPAITVEPILRSKSDIAPREEADFNIDVSLRETGGRATELEASVVGVGRKSGADYVAVGVSAGVTPESAFRIEANSSRRLNVDIDDLPGPGEYKGTLRLAGREGPPVDTPFVVFVRYRWLLAAALILVGLMLSEPLRLYRLVWKPKLVQRARASAASEEIHQLLAAAPGGGPEHAIADVLERRLHVLVREANFATDVAAGIKEVEDKLPAFARWVAQWRRAREAGLPADVVVHLDEVARALGAQGEWAASGAKVAADALAAADRALSGEAVLRGQLVDLGRDVDGWLQAGGAETTAEEISAKLEEASAKLDARDPTAAASLLRTAQGMWAKALAGDLSALANQPPPAGVASAEWNAASTKLRLDAGALAHAHHDEAAELYRAAYAPVVDLMIRGLRATVESRTLAAMNDPDLAGLLPQLFELRSSLAEETLPTEVDTRRRRYTEAAEKYETMKQFFSSAGLMGPTDDPLAVAPGSVGTPVATPPQAGPTPMPKALPSTTSIMRRIVFGEVVTFLVFLTAALITGVVLLWAPNETWGSVTDQFIAVAWGLGLHQVGGATLGVPDVRKAVLAPEGS